MAKIKLTTPWSEHYEKINAMFKNDPEVHVFYDDEAKLVKVYVENEDKANALDEILIHEVKFGRVTLKVNVIPANTNSNVVHSVYARALTGNDALVSVDIITGAFDHDLTYVTFKKEVVQYFNDDLGDIHGIRSTLYEDIAREIFVDNPFVFFCTDVPENSVFSKV